ADLEQIVGAPAEPEVAALVDVEQIARATPVAVECLPALVAILEVAVGDAVALDPEDADLVGRQCRCARTLGVLGEDLERVAVDGAAERAGHDVARAVR